MQDFSKKLRELCLKLYDVGALKFGDFKMKVGLNSPVYFDLRVIVSHPAVLEELSILMWKFSEYQGLHPVVLCGVPYTALPITTIVAVKSHLPMLIRRKEPKNYGNMKLIEGKFSAGDECLIIEDVVTSGCSILETANDLRRDGLVVKDTVVVLDRTQGGDSNLKNEGIRMHSLLTLDKVLDILCEEQKIDTLTCNKVKSYINDNQMFPDGRLKSKIQRENRLKMSFADRRPMVKNPLANKLLELMNKKKSNLCVAIDMTSSEELLKMVHAVGEYACIIKTHYDLVSDWNSNTENSLLALAKQYDFMIMEDRKFGDVGSVVSKQCNMIFRWADLVTVHTIPGTGVIAGTKEAATTYGEKGIFLVAELSSKNNLIAPHYTKTTGDLGVTHNDIVVGLVCQTPSVISNPGLLQLTPGVAHNQGVGNLGQQYVTPEEAVLIKGGDIIVVGSSITKSSDPHVAAKSMRDKLWEAYLQRINNN